MSRTRTPSFVCEIPLRTDPHTARVLGVRFDCARQVYNALLGEALRRLDLLRQSKAYQTARRLPKGKARTAAFSAARITHGFREYDLYNWTPQFTRSWLGSHLDAHTTQALASRAFRAVEQHALGTRGRPHFARHGTLTSVEGRTNAQGIRWVPDRVVWKDLVVPGILDPHDPVQRHGLAARVKFVRLVRRAIGNQDRYYAQLVCEGVPYQKPANTVGTGVIGVDPGPRVFAFAGDTWAARVDLSHPAHQAQLRRAQRALDRRRRAANPGNYLPDGRIRPGKKQWHHTHSEQRARRQVAEIQRRAAAARKTAHGTLANALLRRGNTIQIERNSYRAFQRSRYGKSVGNAAPGAFVALLTRKAAAVGATVIEIPARLRLSQTCHGCGTIQKKPLSQRVHACGCGVTAQRDVYSAFLARCCGATTESQDSGWCLDADQARRVWSGLESALSAASGLLSVEQFAGSQPATGVSCGAVPLSAQAGGAEPVADAGERVWREAWAAVFGATQRDPMRASRRVPRTPPALAVGVIQRGVVDNCSAQNILSKTENLPKWTKLLTFRAISAMMMTTLTRLPKRRPQWTKMNS